MADKPISARMRYDVYRRDKYTCQYCGSNENQETQAPLLTLDHIVAKIDGGIDHPSNLITCCRQCNSIKGTKPLEDFRFLMRLHASNIGGVITLNQAKELLNRGVNLGLIDTYTFHFEKSSQLGMVRK